ncbi:MAG: FkbM family methyltransferase [Anaerolineae bacterium]|nr:FkbM family methyltransferase [Anaerolineae bacterium]
MNIKRILKNIIYRIIRTFWLRKGTVRTVPVGPYQSIRFELSAIMQRRIEVFFRAYEPNVTAWLEQTIKPGMTVYVVGAHVGIHVLYIARLLQGQGHIYAFEGWPENFALLQRNIALNDHLETGITSVQSVVSEKSGKINMASGGSDGKHHIAAAAQTNHHQIEADGISLNDFHAENDHCASVILMDIEGHELDALKGATVLLQTCHPRLGLEHHEHGDALESWLTANGYTIDSRDKRHIFAS